MLCSESLKPEQFQNRQARLSWVVLTIWLGICSSCLIVSSVFAQVFPPEVKRVAEDFVCQCGCNHQLSACGMVNCGSAVPLQEEIQGYLKQGKSHPEIREIFVAKYSKLILSTPTTRGFDLTAWTMPFVMLLLGLMLVYSLIRVWARRKPTLALEGPGGAPLVPDNYQQQIEKELKDYDS